ncbi:MAG: SDR family NAD-dependent epimerase/dehydratase, partial [Deltaproteobacteria bacterium]
MDAGAKRVLVTGGSGFIGTRLVAALLEAGHMVTIYDKRQ